MQPLLLSLLVSAVFAVDLDLRSLTDPLAVCNDGSIATYYVQDDEPSPQQNVVIFMQGGGLCTEEISCQGRCLVTPFLCEASTDAVITQESGIFSSDPTDNPAFHNYYKVYVPYCSSDIYSGNRAAMDGGNEESEFHFRGYRIIEAIVRDLQTHINLGEARSVIITGASAGGMGAIVHCDSIAQMIPRAGVRCIPDSGSFSPHQLLPPEEGCPGIGDPNFDFTGVKNYWNGTLPSGCTAAIPEPRSHRECAMASIAYKYIQSPTVMSTMKHDSFFAGLWCYTDCDDTNHVEYNSAWNNHMTAIAEELVANYSSVGLFMPSCWGHTLIASDVLYSDTRAGANGLTFAQVVYNWMQGNGSIHAWDRCDTGPLCNVDCGGDDC